MSMQPCIWDVGDIAKLIEEWESNSGEHYDKQARLVRA